MQNINIIRKSEASSFLHMSCTNLSFAHVHIESLYKSFVYKSFVHIESLYKSFVYSMSFCSKWPPFSTMYIHGGASRQLGLCEHMFGVVFYWWMFGLNFRIWKIGCPKHTHIAKVVSRRSPMCIVHRAKRRPLGAKTSERSASRTTKRGHVHVKDMCRT